MNASNASHSRSTTDGSGGPDNLLSGCAPRTGSDASPTNLPQSAQASLLKKRRIIDFPGVPHYVTFSTYQRRQFLAPERTKSIVVESLQMCLQSHRATCHGFVIMPDHVHAILSIDPTSKIASFLQPWKKTSSYRIGQFYKQEFSTYRAHCPRDCPIWQAKYYSYLIESDEKLSEKLDYMHNNPVVACLTRNYLDWNWSSAPFYAEGKSVGVTITP